MQDFDDHDLPADLEELSARLRREATRPSAQSLDQLKLRAMRQAQAASGGQRGMFMRSRLATASHHQRPHHRCRRHLRHRRLGGRRRRRQRRQEPVQARQGLRRQEPRARAPGRVQSAAPSEDLRLTDGRLAGTRAVRLRRQAGSRPHAHPQPAAPRTPTTRWTTCPRCTETAATVRQPDPERFSNTRRPAAGARAHTSVRDDPRDERDHREAERLRRGLLAPVEVEDARLVRRRRDRSARRSRGTTSTRLAPCFHSR